MDFGEQPQCFAAIRRVTIEYTHDAPTRLPGQAGLEDAPSEVEASQDGGEGGAADDDDDDDTEPYSGVYLPPIELQSATVSDHQFLTPAFEPVTLRPGETTTIQVILLPRNVAPIKGTLILQTSEGSLTYTMDAEGVPNKYRLKPAAPTPIPVGMHYHPTVSLYNYHDDFLQVKEVFTTDKFLHLSLPGSGAAADALPGGGGADGFASSSTSLTTEGDGGDNGAAAVDTAGAPEDHWRIRPHSMSSVIKVSFQTHSPGKYSGYIHIKTNKDDMVLPVDLTVLRGGLVPTPQELKFGAVVLPPLGSAGTTNETAVDALVAQASAHPSPAVTKTWAGGLPGESGPWRTAVPAMYTRSGVVSLLNTGLSPVHLVSVYVPRADPRIKVAYVPNQELVAHTTQEAAVHVTFSPSAAMFGRGTDSGGRADAFDGYDDDDGHDAADSGAKGSSKRRKGKSGGKRRQLRAYEEVSGDLVIRSDDQNPVFARLEVPYSAAVMRGRVAFDTRTTVFILGAQRNVTLFGVQTCALQRQTATRRAHRNTKMLSMDAIAQLGAPNDPSGWAAKCVAKHGIGGTYLAATPDVNATSLARITASHPTPESAAAGIADIDDEVTDDASAEPSEAKARDYVTDSITRAMMLFRATGPGGMTAVPGMYRHPEDVSVVPSTGVTQAVSIVNDLPVAARLSLVTVSDTRVVILGVPDRWVAQPGEAFPPLTIGVPMSPAQFLPKLQKRQPSLTALARAAVHHAMRAVAAEVLRPSSPDVAPMDPSLTAEFVERANRTLRVAVAQALPDTAAALRAFGVPANSKGVISPTYLNGLARMQGLSRAVDGAVLTTLGLITSYGSSRTRFNATLTVYTNVTAFQVPLSVCYGRLSLHTVDAAYEPVVSRREAGCRADMNGPDMPAVPVPIRVKELDDTDGRDGGAAASFGPDGVLSEHAMTIEELNFGTVALGSKHTMRLRLVNENPVNVTFRVVALDPQLAKHASVRAEVMPGPQHCDGKYLALGDAGGHSSPTATKGVVLAPGSSMFVVLELTAPDAPIVWTSHRALEIRTDYEVALVRVKFNAINGGIRIKPRMLEIGPTLPGRSNVREILATNEFDVAVKVSKVSAIDANLAVSVLEDTIPAGKTVAVATVALDTALHNRLHYNGTGGSGRRCGRDTSSSIAEAWTSFFGADAAPDDITAQLSSSVTVHTDVAAPVTVPVSMQTYRPSLVHYTSRAADPFPLSESSAALNDAVLTAAERRASAATTKQDRKGKKGKKDKKKKKSKKGKKNKSDSWASWMRRSLSVREKWLTDVLPVLASASGVAAIPYYPMPLTQIGRAAALPADIIVFNPYDHPLLVSLHPPCSCVYAKPEQAAGGGAGGEVEGDKSLATGDDTGGALAVADVDPVVPGVDMLSLNGSLSHMTDVSPVIVGVQTNDTSTNVVLPLPSLPIHVEARALLEAGEMCCDACPRRAPKASGISPRVGAGGLVNRSSGYTPFTEGPGTDHDDNTCAAMRLPSTYGVPDDELPACVRREHSPAWGFAPDAVVETVIPPLAGWQMGPVMFAPERAGLDSAIIWLTNNVTGPEPIQLVGEGADADLWIIDVDARHGGDEAEDDEDGDGARGSDGDDVHDDHGEDSALVVAGADGEGAAGQQHKDKRVDMLHFDFDASALDASAQPPSIRSDLYHAVDSLLSCLAARAPTEAVATSMVASGIRALSGLLGIADPRVSDTRANQTDVITKRLLLSNRGKLSVAVLSFDISGAGCTAFGFSVSDCDSLPFTLAAGEERNITVSFVPDCAASKFYRELLIPTSRGPLQVSLVARTPEEMLGQCLDAKAASMTASTTIGRYMTLAAGVTLVALMLWEFLWSSMDLRVRLHVPPPPEPEVKEPTAEEIAAAAAAARAKAKAEAATAAAAAVAAAEAEAAAVEAEAAAARAMRNGGHRKTASGSSVTSVGAKGAAVTTNAAGTAGRATATAAATTTAPAGTSVPVAVGHSKGGDGGRRRSSGTVSANGGVPTTPMSTDSGSSGSGATSGAKDSVARNGAKAAADKPARSTGAAGAAGGGAASKRRGRGNSGSSDADLDSMGSGAAGTGAAKAGASAGAAGGSLAAATQGDKGGRGGQHVAAAAGDTKSQQRGGRGGKGGGAGASAASKATAATSAALRTPVDAGKAGNGAASGGSAGNGRSGTAGGNARRGDRSARSAGTPSASGAQTPGSGGKANGFPSAVRTPVYTPPGQSGSRSGGATASGARGASSAGSGASTGSGGRVPFNIRAPEPPGRGRHTSSTVRGSSALGTPTVTTVPRDAAAKRAGGVAGTRAGYNGPGRTPGPPSQGQAQGQRKAAGGGRDRGGAAGRGSASQGPAAGAPQAPSPRAAEASATARGVATAAPSATVTATVPRQHAPPVGVIGRGGAAPARPAEFGTAVLPTSSAPTLTASLSSGAALGGGGPGAVGSGAVGPGAVGVSTSTTAATSSLFTTPFSFSMTSPASGPSVLPTAVTTSPFGLHASAGTVSPGRVDLDEAGSEVAASAAGYVLSAMDFDDDDGGGNSGGGGGGGGGGYGSLFGGASVFSGGGSSSLSSQGAPGIYDAGTGVGGSSGILGAYGGSAGPSAGLFAPGVSMGATSGMPDHIRTPPGLVSRTSAASASDAAASAAGDSTIPAHHAGASSLGFFGSDSFFGGGGGSADLAGGATSDGALEESTGSRGAASGSSTT